MSYLYALRANILNEVETNNGRIDAVLFCDKYIYIIEFKLNQKPGKAIEQIKEKKYFEKYLKDKREIYLLGINFSSQEKNIVEYKEEKL